MKKIYLLACSIAVTTTASAQRVTDQKNPDPESPHQLRVMPRQMVQDHSRVGGTVVWTEDFANGLAGNNPSGAWTTSGVDGAVWMYDNDGPNGLYSDAATEVILSTSAGNGFMIFDADYENNQGDPLLANNATKWEGDLVSPVIDLSSTSCALLEWEQAMRWCCNGNSPLLIDVTTNGFGSFTTFDAKSANMSTNLFSGTETRTLNITSAIAANPSTVQFRFRWGVPAGSNNGSHYFWQVDDVSVLENYQVNHKPDTVLYGASQSYFMFTQIPEDHFTNLELAGTVANDGCSTTTNVGLESADDMGVLATTNSEASLAIGDTTSFLTGNTAVSYTQGTMLELKVYPYSDQVEGLTNDDTMTFPIEITKPHCGRFAAYGDQVETVLSGNNFPTAYTNGAGYGAYHEMQVNDTVNGIWIAPTDSSINYGAPVELQVWVDDGVSGNQMLTSYITNLPSSNLGQFVYLDLPPANHVPVNAGDVVIGIVRDYSGETRIFGGGNTGSTAFLGAMWEYDAAGVPTEYLAPKAPFVQLQMGICDILSIEEESMISFLGQNVPNPVTDHAMVEFSLLENAEVEFEIRDVTGKLITHQSLGNRPAGTHSVEIDASQLADGVYFYSVKADENSATKRMVVSR